MSIWRTIWRTAPVSEEPEIRLSRWKIIEEGGRRYFVGNDGAGRVSNVIVEFDKEKRVGKTRSGRIYKLIGGPAMNIEAEYVLSRWKAINGVDSVTDVTDQIFGEEDFD